LEDDELPVFVKEPKDGGEELRKEER